jgi:putative hydrolase of HD superfamily
MPGISAWVKAGLGSCSKNSRYVIRESIVVETKSEIPYMYLSGDNVPAIVRVYFEFNHLKNLFRQGWLKRGIPKQRCESVAEHTFGVVVLTYFLAEAYFPELDADRVIRMALLHDFGEIYAGDITPQDQIKSDEKHQRERQAVERVFGDLPGGESFLDLWDEFEAGVSPEARFVHQIDRLEMALQASVYEHSGYPNLQEFFDTSDQAISEPRLRQILEAVRDLRYR